MSTTDDPKKVDTTIGPDGQQRSYLVLSEEERAKGFVRPVRLSYVHVGPAAPEHPLRDLTLEEKERYRNLGYVKYEEFPAEVVEERGLIGKFWTLDALRRADGGCRGETTMGRALAETYARNPGFYSGTFCFNCKKHFPVGEFVWKDGSRVGT